MTKFKEGDLHIILMIKDENCLLNSNNLNVIYFKTTVLYLFLICVIKNHSALTLNCISKVCLKLQKPVITEKSNMHFILCT